MVKKANPKYTTMHFDGSFTTFLKPPLPPKEKREKKKKPKEIRYLPIYVCIPMLGGYLILLITV